MSVQSSNARRGSKTSSKSGTEVRRGSNVEVAGVSAIKAPDPKRRGSKTSDTVTVIHLKKKPGEKPASCSTNGEEKRKETEEDSTREGARTEAPSVRRPSQIPSVKELVDRPDPDMYNPDGSLRTIHKIQDVDYAYDEARKARYLRSKEQLEKDKELSLNEIFAKK